MRASPLRVPLFFRSANLPDDGQLLIRSDPVRRTSPAVRINCVLLGDAPGRRRHQPAADPAVIAGRRSAHRGPADAHNSSPRPSTRRPAGAAVSRGRISASTSGPPGDCEKYATRLSKEKGTEGRKSFGPWCRLDGRKDEELWMACLSRKKHAQLPRLLLMLLVWIDQPSSLI